MYNFGLWKQMRISLSNNMQHLFCQDTLHMHGLLHLHTNRRNSYTKNIHINTDGNHMIHSYGKITIFPYMNDTSISISSPFFAPQEKSPTLFSRSDFNAHVASVSFKCTYIFSHLFLLEVVAYGGKWSA